MLPAALPSPHSAQSSSHLFMPLFAFCSDQNKTKEFSAFIQKPLFNNFFCVCAFLLQEVGSIIGKVCLFYFSVHTLIKKKTILFVWTVIIFLVLFVFLQKGETVKKMREEVGSHPKQIYDQRYIHSGGMFIRNAT